jgi:hypothetical protein
VKTLDHFGLGDGGRIASLPSCGVVWSSGRLRSCFDVFGGKSSFFCTFLFIFGLLCKRISSSLCIGSAVVTLFIKLGESLFRGQ